MRRAERVQATVQSGRRRGRAALTVLAMTLFLGWLFGSAGCTPHAGLLGEVQVSRPTVVVGDGRRAVADLRYVLTGPARVDVYLSGLGDERVYLRHNEERPSAGSYVFRFDGTYALPDDPVQRRVLPGGAYQLTVAARDAAGRVEEEAVSIEVRSVDAAPPAIENFRVQPAVITPNFDGRDDVAHLSYRLTKPGEVWLYAEDDQGVKRWIGPSLHREAGEYGAEWNALVRGQPLPDGLYQFVVRVTDAIGNVSVARAPIQVVSAGLPRARLLSVTFSPRKLMIGDLLRVEMRVRNEGETPLLTQGPPPGYVYGSYDNYFSIEDHALVDKAGRWRVGVDWAGSPGSAGGKYPYRWGFGKDLAPGEETTVVGYIRLEHRDQRAAFGDNPAYHRMWFYAALVQEGVAVHQDHAGQTEIEVSF